MHNVERPPDFLKQEIVMLDYVVSQMYLFQNYYLDAYGITGKQSKLLMFLIHHSDQAFTQKDLQRIFCLRGSTVTSILKYLEKGGFIQRKTDALDARKKCIALTAKGKAMEPILLKLHEQQQKLFLDGFAPEDRGQFIQFLHQLVHNADKWRIEFAKRLELL